VVQLSRLIPMDTGTLNMPAAYPQSAHSGGFSLLEVLIAVLVLALGILGAASLQLNALRYHSGALYATQANVLAQDMLERMRANPGQLSDYNLTVASPCLEGQSLQLAPIAGSIIEQDKIDFSRAVACELPDGRAWLTVKNGVALVRLSWSEGRQFADAQDAELELSALIGVSP